MGLLDDAIREHLDLKRSRGADPAEIERAEREALGPVRREPIGGEEFPMSTMAIGSETNTEPDGGAGDWEDPLAQHGDLPATELHDPPPLDVTKPSHGSGLRGRFLSRRRHEPAQEEAEHPADDHFEAQIGPEPPRSVDYEPYQAEYPAIDEPVEPPTVHPAIERTPSPPAVHDDVHTADVPEPPAPVRAEPGPPEAEPPEPDTPQGDASGGETVEYDVEESMKSEDPDEDVLEETPEFLQDTPEHDRLWFEQRAPRDFDFDG